MITTKVYFNIKQNNNRQHVYKQFLNNTERIIEAVRARPALWNIRDMEFKNRTIRPRLWEEVAMEASKFTLSLSVYFVVMLILF